MIERFFYKNVISVLCGAALAFVLGGFVWACLALRGVGVADPDGSSSLILHFANGVGITSVGGLDLIIFMGIFGLLVVAMNFAIARELESRDRFFGRFLAVMTLVFAVLLFIAFAAIINVNV
jgi:hypothetical protein